MRVLATAGYAEKHWVSFQGKTILKHQPQTTYNRLYVLPLFMRNNNMQLLKLSNVRTNYTHHTVETETAKKFNHTQYNISFQEVYIGGIFSIVFFEK